MGGSEANHAAGAAGAPATRILGVDPGSVVVGWGCLDVSVRSPAAAAPRQPPVALRARNVVAGPGRGSIVRLTDRGLLRLGSRSAPLADRLLALAQGIAALLERLRPDELALEEAFYGKSVQSAMRIGEARGVILAEACRRGVVVHQFAPARIKRVVAGNGAATKDAVAAMTGQLLGVRMPGERDVTDALAVALCCVEARRGAGR